MCNPPNTPSVMAGDAFRWYWENGELSVEIVRQRSSVFADFDGFEGMSETLDHDRSGLIPSGEKTTDTPVE